MRLVTTAVLYSDVSDIKEDKLKEFCEKVEWDKFCICEDIKILRLYSKVRQVIRNLEQVDSNKVSDELKHIISENQSNPALKAKCNYILRINKNF